LIARTEGSRRKRLGAMFVLVVGVAIVLTMLKPDWPREQTLIFRLPRSDATPVRLEAAFTPVGAVRAVQGFSLDLSATRARDVRHQPRIPDGDYLVTIELTSTHSTGSIAPVKLETSEVRRVTLSGEETLIVLDGESSK
jgi:hypothetical protein